MTYNPLYILSLLCLMIILSEWLVRHSFFRHFGTALVVILLTAIVANLGFLPTGSSKEAPVLLYNGIFSYVAPLSIFWLLLAVNLKDILQTGPKMLTLFVLSALGTVVGVVVAMFVVNGPVNIGEQYDALGGMFVGTYTGGSINFNALALHYNIVQEGLLYTGAVAVDNVVTAIWMVMCIALPALLAPFWKHVKTDAIVPEATGPSLGIEEDTEAIHPLDLAIVLALGVGALLLAKGLAGYFSDLGYAVPMILILTIVALLLAQLPLARRINGAQTLGMFSIYLFLAVIGAFCDFSALRNLGNLGFVLLGFTFIVVFVHALITFAIARLLRVDLAMTAVVSQANVGGGTTALALARSLGRTDLVLPAILLGSLGTALGTFLGFWSAEQLLPWLLGG
ncbi:MAG: DUF819 family protein [Bacteroidota bacterium]